MPGLDKVRNKFTFTTLDDALALDSALRAIAEDMEEKTRVLIMGAGLIGLKCAEGISKRNVSVSFVDLAPRILSSILDDESAEIVKEHLEEHGISFCLGRQVKEFREDTAYEPVQADVHV